MGQGKAGHRIMQAASAGKNAPGDGPGVERTSILSRPLSTQMENAIPAKIEFVSLTPDPETVAYQPEHRWCPKPFGASTRRMPPACPGKVTIKAETGERTFLLCVTDAVLTIGGALIAQSPLVVVRHDAEKRAKLILLAWNRFPFLV